MLISSHGGLNLLIGNGPEADGTFRRVLDIEPSVSGQWTGVHDTLRRELGREVTASEASRILARRAIGWTIAHPVDEARLIGRKARYALSSAFLTLSHSYPFFARDVPGPLAFLAIGPAFIVPLGLVGLVVAGPRGARGYWLWAAYVPLTLAAVVLLFVAARYRLPLQVALTAAAGGGIVWMVDRIRRRAWSALGLALTAAIALGVFRHLAARAGRWPGGGAGADGAARDCRGPHGRG